jgi:hypothetical protein
MTGRFEGECLFHWHFPVVSFGHLVQQRGLFLTRVGPASSVKTLLPSDD